MTGYTEGECAHGEMCAAESIEGAYGFIEYHECQLEQRHEEAHVCHCGVTW